jgi:hypothetical protein
LLERIPHANPQSSSNLTDCFVQIFTFSSHAIIFRNNLLDAWKVSRDSFYGNIVFNNSKGACKADINWHQGKDCLQQYIRRWTEEVRAIRQIDPTRQIVDWRIRKERKTTLGEASQQLYKWYTKRVRAQRGEALSRDRCL